MRVPGTKSLSFTGFIKQLIKAYSENGVSDSAAQLSYYLLFSLFPFLFFLVTLTAYLPLGGVVPDMMHSLSNFVPRQAFALVQGQLDSLLHEPRPKLLTLGLLTALYSASRGVDSMRAALNRAYQVTESRSFLRTQATSIGMTVVGTALVVGAFAIIILGGRAGAWLFDRVGIGSAFVFAYGWLRWPLTALVIMMTAALGYYVLPDVKQRSFRYLTPGSVLGTAFWLVGTWGFTFYAGHFSGNNATYGSIAGVILLLTWFYLSGLIFILGGVVNALIEHASPDGKEVGARDVGEPAAPLAQRVLAQTPGASKKASTAQRLKQVFRRAKPLPPPTVGPHA